MIWLRERNWNSNLDHAAFIAFVIAIIFLLGFGVYTLANANPKVDPAGVCVEAS